MRPRKGTIGYLVVGYVPNLGLVKEFVHEYHEGQALLVAHENLKKRHPRIVVPPLGPYCKVIKCSR